MTVKINLEKYGITGTTEIVHNPSYDLLFNEETKPELEGFEKGQLTELDTMNVMTGVFTGRSPKDKFVVKSFMALYFNDSASIPFVAALVLSSPS